MTEGTSDGQKRARRRTNERLQEVRKGPRQALKKRKEEARQNRQTPAKERENLSCKIFEAECRFQPAPSVIIERRPDGLPVAARRAQVASALAPSPGTMN